MGQIPRNSTERILVDYRVKQINKIMCSCHCEKYAELNRQQQNVVQPLTTRDGRAD